MVNRHSVPGELRLHHGRHGTELMLGRGDMGVVGENSRQLVMLNEW